METGFCNLKDILSVVLGPITIFIVGALLPGWFARVKARKFLSLIERELDEMEPWPKEKSNLNEWHHHLKKRFIHEEIFEKKSENRDFIISLPPEVSYNMTQLWSHYKKAQDSKTKEDIANHGAYWCIYIQALCMYFDGKTGSYYKKKLCLPWKSLLLEYHPELRDSDILKKVCNQVL
jgi:hypothetical protein